MGDAPDFDSFYSMHYERTYRAACLVAGDTTLALDATQEAFARALERWTRLRLLPWAAGWVMTTSLNLCKRRIRDVPRPDVELRIEPGASADASDRIDLLDAVKVLPFRQRQAIALHYLGDLPVPAVAHLMGVSEGTVKAHLAQARKALRTALEVIDA